ncbi:MAG: hypothetical protein QQN63_14585, partial [Nitrosopumilus sp.]
MSDALTAEYERWCDAFHEGSDAVKRIAQETLDLRAEAERLNNAVYMWDKVRAERDKAEAKVERLKKALDLQTWCPNCGRVLEIPNPGVAKGMEQAAKSFDDLQDDWLLGRNAIQHRIRAKIKR